MEGTIEMATVDIKQEMILSAQIPGCRFKRTNS